MTRTLLVIDDDPAVRNVISDFFRRRGWQVATAATGAAGFSAYEHDSAAVVLLDLQLPDISGLDLLRALRARDPDTTVVMLTGHGQLETAVAAMQLGAENFLGKPIEMAHLEAVVLRALEKVDLRERSRFYADREIPSHPELSSLGQSPRMRDVARQVELIAAGDTTVLLLGETGVGKGWVARLIHALGPRVRNAFVDINCAGLSATFLDSELFGHERGAFTDAKTQKRGLFEVADRGTLFLDEVGDLAADLQPKLLKVLESRRFRRLGGTHELSVDVRLVAATNRDLAAAARSGDFREDLFYRLAVLPLRIPPLRERTRKELAELAQRLLAELRGRHSRGPVRLTPDALDMLARYPWPGNIRELQNVLERAVLLAPDIEEIHPIHLPLELRDAAGTTANDGELTLSEMERRHIANVLARCAGNRSRCAEILGIARATLYEKIRRYELG